MEEKDILNNLNGIEYSQEEIRQYLELADMEKEELSKISGVVKTNFALSEIYKINKNVLKILEKGECLEKIIKVRNIKAIDAITLSSILGLTMFGSSEFGVFDILYLTNRRLILVNTNVTNSPLKSVCIDKADIIALKFTTRVVRVVKDKQKEAKVKVETSKIKKAVYIIALVSFFGGIGLDIMGFEALSGILYLFGFSVPIALAITLRDAITNPIKMAMKDGTVYSMLIASDDYKKCYEYFKDMAKEIEDKV